MKTIEEVKEAMSRKEGFVYDVMNIPNELKEYGKNLCRQFNLKEYRSPNDDVEIFSKLFGMSNPLIHIQPNFYCDYGFNIYFHGRTIINFNCVILDTSTVDIGENVFIAPNVTITCAGHSMDATQRANAICTSKPITIGKNVWIGANCVINQGVTIGDNTVIGAGSVVTRDIPSGVVAYGTPCKAVREITENDAIPQDNILF